MHVPIHIGTGNILSILTVKHFNYCIFIKIWVLYNVYYVRKMLLYVIKATFVSQELCKIHEKKFHNAVNPLQEGQSKGTEKVPNIGPKQKNKCF